MLPSPRALLFDLDGTLVDSRADLAAASNVARAHFGLPPLPVSTLTSFVGDGARMLVQRALDGDVVRVDEGLRVFRAHYREHLLDHTFAFPGVADGLAALAEIPKAVVSNKPQDMTEGVLAGLGLAGRFAAIVGARRSVPVKPAPDMVELALAEMGCATVEPAASVWMVGDSRNDVGVGRAVGATTVAVSWGIGELAELQGLGPDRVVDSFEQLVELVESAAGRSPG